jgi:hypothetical protein
MTRVLCAFSMPGATVSDFLGAVPPETRRTVVALRRIVRGAARGSRETVVWRSLSYHIPELGGRVKGAVCLITPRRGYVELGFIHGALLPDPQRLLTGNQKEKRVVRVERVEDLPRPALVALVKAAVEVRPDAGPPFSRRILRRPTTRRS